MSFTRPLPSLPPPPQRSVLLDPPMSVLSHGSTPHPHTPSVSVASGRGRGKLLASAAGPARLLEGRRGREDQGPNKRKDPNEPQKPLSAYALFFRDTQAAIKGQNPNATFGEVSKIVVSMWDSLAEEQKQVPYTHTLCQGGRCLLVGICRYCFKQWRFTVSTRCIREIQKWPKGII